MGRVPAPLGRAVSNAAQEGAVAQGDAVILLDTHAWLWLGLEPRRLSAAAITHAIGTGGLAIASISLWETALLITAGRLLPLGTEEAWLRALVDRSGVVVKQTTPAIALLSAHWPADFPRDPADRVIAASARAEGLPLVTSDARLRRSRLVETVW
ncbi:MAG: PIN domain nuclease [Candidatus Rokuibacteriota bacterium]|nr:MAG: PIN domain nuclease [Candidatus Rokubacteria bacterium]